MLSDKEFDWLLNEAAYAPDEEPDQPDTAVTLLSDPEELSNLDLQVAPEPAAERSLSDDTWKSLGFSDEDFINLTPERSLSEELGAGIDRGVDQTQGLGYGFVGLLGQAVGLEGVEEYGVENYLRKMEEAAMNQASVRDPFEEIDDLGDAGLYAAGIIGEQIPQLLVSALGGGISGLAAKTIGKRVVGNMINKRVSAGLAGQTFADDAARVVATTKLRDEAAKDVAKETAGTLLGNAGQAGGVSGAYLANFGQISGGSFGQMAQELGQGDAGIAAGFAVGGAALDTLGEVFIASKFLKPFSKAQRAAVDGVDTSLSLGRVGGGAATGFAAGSTIEGGTEYVQTGLEQAALGAADPNRTIEDVVMTPEAGRERLIAAAAGATVGAPLGGVGGAFEVAFSPRTTQTLNDRARQTQTTQTAQETTPAILTTEGWEEPVTVGENIRIARSRNGLFAGIDLPEELASDFQTVTDEDGRRISLLVDDLEVGEKTATLIQDARMAYAQKANLLPQREFDFVSGLPKEESAGDYNPPTEEDPGVITPQPTGTPPGTGPTGGQAEFTFEAATSAPQPSRSPGTTEQRSEPATAGTGILPVEAAAAVAPAPASAPAPIAVPPQQTPAAPSIKGELDPDARDTKQATRASETLSRPVETVAPFVESLKEGDRVSVAMPNARNRKAKMVPAVFAQRLENGDAVFQLEDGKSVMIPPEKFNRVGMFRPEDTKTAPVAKVTKEQLGPTPTKAKIEQTFGVQNYKPGQVLKQTVTDGNGDAPVPVLTRLLKKKGSENDYLVETEGEFTNDPLASVRQMNAGLPIYLPENQDLNLLSPDIEVTPVEVAGGGTRNKVTAVNLWGRTYRQGAEPSDFSVSRAPDGGMSQGETRGLGVFNSIYRLSPERMRRSAAGMQAARTREQAKRMKPEELAAGLNNLDPVDQAILEDGAQRALAYINRKTSTKGQATTDETRDAARDLATDNIMIDVVKAASARKDKLPAASVPVARRVISAFNDLLTRPLAAGQRRDTQAEAQRAGESVVGELVAAGLTEVEARAAVAPIISRVSAISSPISAAEDALKSATKTAIRTEANQAAATADLAEGTVGEAAAPNPASRRAKAPSRAEAAKIETMAQRKARLTEEDEDLMQALLAGEELRGPDVARVEEIEAYLSGSKTYEEIYTEAQRAGRSELSDPVRGRTAGQKVSGITASRAGRPDGSRSTRGAVGVGGPDRTGSGTVPGVPAQQDGGSGVRVSAGLTPAEQRARALGARRFLVQRFFRLTDEETNAATEGQLDRAYDAIRNVLSPTAANQGRRAVAATKAQQVADLADARPEDLLAGVAQERAEALRNRQRTENVRRLAAEMFRGGAFDSTRNLLEFIANTKSLPRDMQLRAKSALGLQSRGFNWNNVATQIGIFRNRDGSRTTWAGLLGKDRDGGKSIAINLDNGHDRGTTYQTFLHEIQHVLNDAKWDAYYGLPGGQNLKLNKTELAAIKRVENFWKRAVKAAAGDREIAFPDSPTDADYARIGEELYALSDPNLDDADRRLAALRNPRELSVEITSSPEVAELLAELGFGKADKDGKVAVKGAIKEAWDALAQLEAGTVADAGSPLAMAFKDAMAINFADTGNKKVDARYTVPGSEPSALTRELAEMRTVSDFIEAELERRGLPGTSEQRAAILEEYEVTQRKPTDPELDTVGDPETMSRAVEDEIIEDVITASRAAPEEAATLEQGLKLRLYRAMQVIDGNLYPPMSAVVEGGLRNPTEIGVWEKAEERPDLLNKDGKFVLRKGNGAVVPAAYNPYFHASSSPLNDQFTSANRRPNLVTVEVEVPASELTSGYRAEGAKNAVGEVSWNSGTVSSKLPADRKRKVVLSRYSKVVRVVPDSEVAATIAELLKGTNLSIPENTVTPSLKTELERNGVDVRPGRQATESRALNETQTSLSNQGATNDTRNQPALQTSAEGMGSQGRGDQVQRQTLRPNAEPNPFVQDGVSAYNARYGLGEVVRGHYAPVDEQRARQIAALYNALPVLDRGAATQEAYGQLAREIQQQWDFAITDMGITFEPWTREGQPYANSREMVRDVRDSQHLWFFTGGEPHPLLNQPDENGLTMNDKLRAIHDLFGHAAEDYQFGPRGEENAWIKHSQMFTPLAQRALTTETRGQNSWVNYGPMNYNPDGTRRTIPASERPFAEQKVALLPEEFMDWRTPLATESRALALRNQVIDPGVVAAAIREAGGITVDIWTAAQPDTGFIVAPFKETETQISLNDFSPAAVRAFVQRFKDLLAVRGMHLGGWLSGPTVYLDASIVTNDQVLATLIAQDGNQLALFDRSNLTELSTADLGRRFSEALGRSRQGTEYQALARTLRETRDGILAGIRGPGRANVPGQGALQERTGLTNENLTESRAVSASPNLVYQDSEGELRGRPRAATDQGYLRGTLLRLKQSSNDGRDLGAGETVRFRADSRGQTDQELEQQRRSQGAEAFRRLIEILEEDGAVLDTETFENTVIEGRHKVGDGSEHQVHLDRPTNRVIKYTNPDVTGSGVVGQSLNVFDYLTNLEAQNEIFGDDIRLEGIVNLGEPYPRLVISQPFVKGRNSTQPQIDAYFGKRGFEKQEDGSWIRVRDGQIQRVWDAVPGNLKTVKVGNKSTVVPFDVQISIEPAVVASRAVADAVSIPIIYQTTETGEAVLDNKGRPKVVTIPYGLLDSPLVNEYAGAPAENTSKPDYDGLHYTVSKPAQESLNAAIDAGSVDEMVRRLVTATREMLQDPAIAAGMGWYGRMRTKLLNLFGASDARVFTHILGTTSAQTPVETNFEYSVDIMRRYQRGEFDGKIKKYLEGRRLLEDGQLSDALTRRSILAKKDQQGLTEADLLAKWIQHYDLLPKQRSGKLYGTNSEAVLKALSGAWMAEKMSPKTPQFAMNLNGDSLEATIDVWAARTLRRLIYEGGSEPWRIQDASEGSVSNEDFILGQVVFRRAAEKLGMNPDDLQAVVWFGEKKNYAGKGWTSAVGALKGSFDEAFDVFFPSGRPARNVDDGLNIMSFIRSERLYEYDKATQGEYDALLKDPNSDPKEINRRKLNRQKHKKDYEKRKTLRGVPAFIRDRRRQTARGDQPTDLQGSIPAIESGRDNGRGIPDRGTGSVEEGTAGVESRATGRFLSERVRVTPTGGTISQGGMFAVDELLDKRAGDAYRSSRMAIKVDVSVIQELSRLLERQMKSIYRGQEVPRETINTALGNLENPLTSQQLDEIESLFNSRRPKQGAKKRDQYIRENRKRFREETQPAALAQLPEEIAATVREMSSHIESLSKRLPNEGLVSGDLAITVDEALGTYLNRSYAIFDDPKWSDSVRKNAKVMDAARKFIRNGLIQSKTADLIDDAATEGRMLSLADAKIMANESVTDPDIEAMLEGYLAVGDEAPSIEILSGRIPGQKNLSMFNRRGNIAPEIQALWGRYEDPTVNYAKTVMKLSSVIANNQFLTEIRNTGLQEGWLWSRENNPDDLRQPPGYVRISTDNNPALAPLGGMYAHPMLAEGLFKMFPVGSTDQHYWWLRSAMKLTGISMAMKTVGSVSSQIRNYLGNYLNLIATGNLGLADIASGDFKKRFTNSTDTILANTFNKYRNATRAEWRAKIDDYIRRGIVGESVTTGLLEDMLTASRKAGSPDFGDVVWDKVSEPFKRVADFAVKTYSSGDDWFKVMIYEAEQDKYRKAYPEWSDDQVKQKAAAVARDIHWTYSLAPAIVQDLKKFPFVAPFVTFTTEVIRTTYNLQKLARQEIMEGRASGNKELEAMGWKRVRGMTTAAFLPLAVGSASMALAGISGDDEEDLRRFLPDWQKNSQLILFRKENGEVSFVDVSFLDPYEYFKKPLYAFMRSLREAESADEILLGGTMAMVRQALDPFTSEQIFAGAIMDVMRNQDAAGRQVYNPQDTGANIGTAVASKIFIEPFTPGTFTSLDRIGKAAFGVQSESGRAYGLFNELASVMAGQRVSEMDAQQALQFKGSRFMREMRDASALFNREFVSQGTRSAGDVVSGYDRSNGARRALVGSIRKDYLAAIRLGVPVARAKAILRDAGVGRETLRMATTGIYKPFEASEDSLSLVRARGKNDRITAYNQARRATPTKEVLP